MFCVNGLLYRVFAFLVFVVYFEYLFVVFVEMPGHGYNGDIVWIESVFFSSGFRYVVRKVPRSEVSQLDMLGTFNPVEISMLSEYVSILRSDYGYRDEEIEFSFLGYFLFDWCFRESECSGSFLFVLHLYRLKMRNRSLYR